MGVLNWKSCEPNVCRCDTFVNGTPRPSIMKPIRVCREGSFHLTIAVDGSGSVGSVNFDKSVDFVEDLIDNLDFIDSRLTLSQFSNNYTEYVSFSNNQEEIDNAIESLRSSYKGDYTFIGNALNQVHNNLHTLTSSGLNYDKNFLIILTNGEASDYDIVKTQAKNLKDDGVTIYSIGVGNRPDVDQASLLELLYEMASEEKSDHVFMAKEFEDLAGFDFETLEKLLSQLCGVRDFCETHGSNECINCLDNDAYYVPFYAKDLNRYEFYQNTGSMDYAVQFCKNRGMRLPFFTNADEYQIFIKAQEDLKETGRRYWIGAKHGGDNDNSHNEGFFWINDDGLIKEGTFFRYFVEPKKAFFRHLLSISKHFFDDILLF